MARNIVVKSLSPLPFAALILLGCPGSQPRVETPPPVEVPPKPDAGTTVIDDGNPAGPTVQDALAFLAKVDADLKRLYIAQTRADWVNLTYINDDTDALAAESAQVVMEYTTSAIKESVKYRDVSGLPSDAVRQLELLRRSPTAPSPSDAALRKELAELMVGMQGTYGKYKYCGSKSLQKWVPKDPKNPKADCLAEGDLKKVLTDPKASWDQLIESWTGWRELSPPLRNDYQRFVEVGNEGARELGYDNVGDLWKSRYDLPPADMEADTERLWQQVKPLYDQLHCYVRSKLATRWKGKVSKTGPMPAHVFGNMWSQDWSGVYDTVAPYPKEPSLDVTKALVKKRYTAKKMVQTAERFFTSMGMPALPQSFWDRSLIEKPRDRDVVCHASAWDFFADGEVRIKMCTEINEEDLVTLHHELGHNYYQLAYQDQPMLFRDGANDGFHEAIGDTIALSVTPDYLVKIGLFDKAVANDKSDLNLLMKRALDGVSFLPFGMLIDKWRWDVFSGKTGPGEYNQAWWDLVLKYQGVVPPTPRGEEFFDPGAKYHVPANTPYLRYFLARIYQFQFYRELCKTAGHTGPLHRCNFFDSKPAGEKLWTMLQMGASKPWPEAMAAVTGDGQADASAILEYFAPLMTWLEEQNKGQECGW